MASRKAWTCLLYTSTCCTMMVIIIVMMVMWTYYDSGLIIDRGGGEEGHQLSSLSVMAISPNPAGSYPALSYKTNDGGQNYTRQVNDVWAKLVEHVHSEDDPTEESLTGYTIVLNKQTNTSQYNYATLDARTGDLVGSGVPVSKGVLFPRPGVITTTTNNTNVNGQLFEFITIPKHLRRTAAGRALVAKTPDPGDGATTRRVLTEASHRLSHISKYDTWNAQVEDLHRHRTLQQGNVSGNGSGNKKHQNLKLLVVPLQFSNHDINNDTPTRWLPTKNELTRLFNKKKPDATVAPSGSVKDIFKTLSHGKLHVTADVMDWIPLTQPESFYAAGKRGYDATFLHQAIREALDYLETVVKLDFSKYDVDGDGLIDSILFMHSGYGAEFGGVSEDGAYFMDRIWSHKWNLFHGGWTSLKHGVKVHNYPLVSALYGTHPTYKEVMEGVGVVPTPTVDKIVRVGVIAHELAHFLGVGANYAFASSSYNNGEGKESDGDVGSWDLMSNAWGFTGDQHCVPLLNPWSRIQLGWTLNTNSAAVQEVTRADSGSLFSMKPTYANSKDAIIYKIADGFSPNEYLLLEYRHRGDLIEKYLPYAHGGLAVWHVMDNNMDEHSAGAQGQNHTRISLLQADGEMDLEHGLNRGDAGDLFHPKGVNLLGPGSRSTDNHGDYSSSSYSEAGLPNYPNTNSYQGYSTGLTLANIDIGIDDVTTSRKSSSSVLPTLTFQVFFDDPTQALTASGSNTNNKAPTKSPTVSPTLQPTTRPTTNAPTWSPTLEPTSSMAPTQVVPDSCPGKQDRLFLLELNTDVMMAGSETIAWELIDARRGPAVIQTGGPYYDHSNDGGSSSSSSKAIRYGACLDRLSCWSFSIKADSAGNGIDLSQQGNAANGAGYKVWWNGELQDESILLADGSSPHFRETGVDFGDRCKKLSQERTVLKIGTDIFAWWASEASMFDAFLVSNAFMFDVHGTTSSVLMRLQTLFLAPWDDDYPVTLKVYTKNGSYQGYETTKDAWTLIATQKRKSEGYHGWTWFDNFDEYPPLMQGTTQAFYVEMDQPVLILSDCSKEVGIDGPGQTWKRFNELDVLSGVVSQPGFAGTAATSSSDGLPTTACLDFLLALSPMTVSPAVDYSESTETTTLTCSRKDYMFVLTLDAPAKAAGLSWSIENAAKLHQHDAAPAVISSPAYADANEPAQYKHAYCLPQKGCYKFVFDDAHRLGAPHSALFNGILVAEGNNNSNKTSLFHVSSNGGNFGSSCDKVVASNGRSTP
jgi:M6 family metalloprotease-like protein